MFKKLLASVGIGSTEIDTRLHTPRVTPGEVVRSEVYVEGRDAKQELDDLSLFFMTGVSVDRRVSRRGAGDPHPALVMYRQSFRSVDWAHESSQLLEPTG